MKNLKFLFLLTMGIFLISVGCEETDFFAENNSEVAITEKCADCTANISGFPVHASTDVTVVNDNEHLLSLPGDVFFVARDTTSYANSQNRNPQPEPVLSIDVASVRCKCTSGSGCNPSRYKKRYSCVMTENCNTCEKETSGSVSRSGNFTDVDIKGIVDYNLGISFLVKHKTGDMTQDQYLTTNEDTYSNAFDELFSLERVQTGVKEFYQKIYGDHVPDFLFDQRAEIPQGYVFAKVNIYGNIAAMPFPKELLNDTYPIVPHLVGGIECSCHEGSGCKKKSAGMGQVKYCDAGDCRDCELKDDESFSAVRGS